LDGANIEASVPDEGYYRGVMSVTDEGYYRGVMDEGSLGGSISEIQVL
jgi:hypothetical protein